MDEKELDKQFDELWSAALEQSYRVEVPDPEPSWNRMSARIASERRARTRRKRRRVSAAVVASFLLGALLFGTPSQTKAFLPITEFFGDLKGSAVGFFYGDQDDRKGLPDLPGTEVQSGSFQSGSREDGKQMSGKLTPLNFKSLEEAQKNSTFHIYKLPDVPEGFNLYLVTVYNGEDGKTFSVVQSYANKEKKGLLITQQVLEPNTTGTIGFANPVQEEQVQVRGKKGQLYWNDITSDLYWSKGDWLFNIGTPTFLKEEIIDLAESLK